MRSKDTAYFSEDRDLMVRFQNGEKRCFDEIVERHKQRVFNIAYRYLGNIHDAEDVTQQVFINIYNSRKAYSPKAQFTTWLYTVCKNTCLKTFRKKRLNTTSIDTDMNLEQNTVFMQVPDPNANTPLENVINSERDLVVKEAIDSLPENQKIVVILYKYEQLSYGDIGKITGFSVKAVKSLLHRARVSLKEKLSSYFNR
ncbi:MAG: sigma-70 family RNA polymerase sigma factor [Candidatus Omnitrophica bacterium]|nr:sigma-70 family RNA polymerase sigma factor [Candidatus Omnitrophota bacterium]